MREELLCLDEEPRHEPDRGREVWALGEVLAELLAQYQSRYPDFKVVLVEAPAGAAP